MKRFALYTRYSSENQNDKSCEDQARECRKFLKTLNDGENVIVEEYSDIAISGFSTLNRPDIIRLITDSKLGKFDAVIAEDLSRLSRNESDMHSINDKLKYLNIQLFTCHDGEVTPMVIAISGFLNAEQLRLLSEKTKRGLVGVIADGRVAGDKSYGYDLSEKAGVRTINEEQAAVIRRIFDDYESGLSAKSIAHALNKEGIKFSKGCKGETRYTDWKPNTISGNRARKTGILHNQMYIGRIVFNRQSWRKNPETGKRVPKLNPASEWLIEEVPELRIISEEQWNRIELIKDRYSTMATKKVRRPKRVLSGLLKCGSCRGPYIISNNRYVCRNQKDRGTCDNRKTILIVDIERRVLEGLKTSLQEPEAVAAYINTYHSEMKALRNQKSSRRVAIETEIRDNAKKMVAILKDIEDGLATREMKLRNIELSNRNIELEAEFKLSEPANIVEMHPNLPDQYQQRISELQASLQSEDDSERSQTVNIIQNMLDEIILYPPKPNDNKAEMSIKIVGDIAALMHLALHQGQMPKDVTLGVIAGARNQREPTKISVKIVW